MKKTGLTKRLWALLLALLMLPVLTLSAVYGTQTDTAATVQTEIDAIQAQIDAKKQEMAGIQSQIDAIRHKATSEQEEKALLDQRNTALQQEISLLQEQIKLTGDNITEIEAQEQQQIELFHKQVRMEEERGTVSYWSVIFKATDFTDFVSRVDFVNEIIAYDNNVIDELRATREELTAQKEALAEQTDSLGAAQDELEMKIAESVQLLAEYYKTQEGMQAQYDAIKAEEDALDDLMAEAERKAQELGQDDIIATAGGYAWPCNNIRWITSLFGGRDSPGGIGSTNHKGVDIGTPAGTPVLAAKAGIVTWASWNGGYGNCVIVSHGKGNSTLYGHLSGYNCSVGQSVSQGQVIAYSGNTGNSTGPHLHFGIKENDTWVDPLYYLTGWHYFG